MQQPSVADVLAAIRSEMNQEKLDILLVPCTDKYLNEYVPLYDNPRYFASGFSGSAGDMIITQEKAYLIADGRYHTQAEQETNPDLITLLKLPLSESPEDRIIKTIAALVNDGASHQKKTIALGFDGQRISVAQLRNLQNQLKSLPIHWHPTSRNLVLDNLPTMEKPPPPYPIRKLDIQLTGKESQEKLQELSREMKEKKLDAYFISRLEEIAYLTNLRGFEIPYNLTYKAFAYFIQWDHLFHLFVFTDTKKIPKSIQKKSSQVISYIPSTYLFEGLQWLIKTKTPAALKENKTTGIQNILSIVQSSEWKDFFNQKEMTLGYDHHSLNYSVYTILEKLMEKRGGLTHVSSLIAPKKAIKTTAEIHGMKYSFARSDRMFRKLIKWVNECMIEEEKISEKDISDKVFELFNENGALALSFQTIAASGTNSAMIHYTNADPEKWIKPGDLILLDAGAYFENGLATDCTRTFIAGGDKVQPTLEQKRIYTMVLQASLSSLMSIFPYSTPSGYLDAFTRKTLYQHKLDFNHGTGHGVGINVHESPPRIRPGSVDKLQPNMVFSIEPGIYIEGWGGVRIENIVVVRQHQDDPDWLYLEILTKAPLDNNLIDWENLTQEEIQFIKNSFQNL